MPLRTRGPHAGPRPRAGVGEAVAVSGAGAEGRAHSRSSRNTLSVRSVIGGCTEIPAEVRLTRKPQLELFGGPAQDAGEGRAVREGGARRGEATSSVDLPTPPVLTVGELAR